MAPVKTLWASHQVRTHALLPLLCCLLGKFSLLINCCCRLVTTRSIIDALLRVLVTLNQGLILIGLQLALSPLMMVLKHLSVDLVLALLGVLLVEDITTS